MVSQAIISFELIDKNMKDFKQSLLDELTRNLNEQNKILKVKSEEITHALSKILIIEPQLMLLHSETKRLD